MEKVYIVEGRTTTYDDVNGGVVAVNATEEGARKRMYKEIDSRCESVKELLEDNFNDEDYAEDFEGYETFEEFWSDWVDKHFVAQTQHHLWRYSDETDYTYEVFLTEKNVED